MYQIHREGTEQDYLLNLNPGMEESISTAPSNRATYDFIK